jgi:hypothetical protein
MNEPKAHSTMHLIKCRGFAGEIHNLIRAGCSIRTSYNPQELNYLTQITIIDIREQTKATPGEIEGRMECSNS